MNDKASELGMKNTVYKNPNGLPASIQVTTARDMLTLSRSYIDTHPDAMRYHGMLEITHGGKTTTNKNPLLRTHPLVDGLKTGWIRASRHNLVTTAHSGDVRLISVVLSAPTSTDLTEGSARLIDAGFRTVDSGGRIKVKEQLEAPEGTLIAMPETPVEINGDGDVSAELPQEVLDAIAHRPGDSRAGMLAETTSASLRLSGQGENSDKAVREIGTDEITRVVAKLCVDSNYHLSESGIGFILSPDDADQDLPPDAAEPSLCMNIGAMVVFAEVGQDVHVTGGGLGEAIEEGIRRGYGDVRPAESPDDVSSVIHYEVVPGDRLRIRILPVGFESESQSRFTVLGGVEDLKEFVTDAVRTALPNICPPVEIGIGIGGTMERSALLAKRSLTRGVYEYNEDEYWAEVESDLVWAINDMDMGSLYIGDLDMVLAVHIETSPTNLPGLPVAVCISCHATNHLEATL
jgi:fumarate hydratase subunit alpha